MSEKTEGIVESRRHRLFSIIVEAARKAGASEALACCFATRLMEDERMSITVKRQQEEGRKQ
jgi:hypothetical protein